MLIAALATTLVVGAMGCGLINKAQQVVGAAKILGDFSDLLQKGEKLTYTATYNVEGGNQVTLTQQPPNSAYIGKSGRTGRPQSHRSAAASKEFPWRSSWPPRGPR